MNGGLKGQVEGKFRKALSFALLCNNFAKTKFTLFFIFPR
jgi:hypothetical protein